MLEIQDSNWVEVAYLRVLNIVPRVSGSGHQAQAGLSENEME